MSVDQRQAAPPGQVPGASARSGASHRGEAISADSTNAIKLSELSKVFGHGRDAIADSKAREGAVGK